MGNPTLDELTQTERGFLERDTSQYLHLNVSLPPIISGIFQRMAYRYAEDRIRQYIVNEAAHDNEVERKWLRAKKSAFNSELNLVVNEHFDGGNEAYDPTCSIRSGLRKENFGSHVNITYCWKLRNRNKKTILQERDEVGHGKLIFIDEVDSLKRSLKNYGKLKERFKPGDRYITFSLGKVSDPIEVPEDVIVREIPIGIRKLLFA